MANIKNLTVLSNGGADSNDALNKVAGSVPALLLQVLETAKPADWTWASCSVGTPTARAAALGERCPADQGDKTRPHSLS